MPAAFSFEFIEEGINISLKKSEQDPYKTWVLSLHNTLGHSYFGDFIYSFRRHTISTWTKKTYWLTFLSLSVNVEKNPYLTIKTHLMNFFQRWKLRKKIEIWKERQSPRVAEPSGLCSIFGLHSMGKEMQNRWVAGSSRLLSSLLRKRASSASTHLGTWRNILSRADAPASS